MEVDVDSYPMSKNFLGGNFADNCTSQEWVTVTCQPCTAKVERNGAGWLAWLHFLVLLGRQIGCCTEVGDIRS